jgi:hypothetical protein
MKPLEVAMGRYDNAQVETGEDDQILGTDNRQFAKRDADQPKRSPIRKKDRWRPEEEMKPKAKRSHKRIQHRLKYDWQGE